ncbi:MAG: methyltransferase domain-containing protein [Hyphomicrobiales bacterium]
MVTPLDKLSYTARQGARVAWYMGHYFAAQRFRDAKSEASTPKPATAPAQTKPKKPSLTAERVLADLAETFRQDLANVEAGYYPMPQDHDGSLPKLIQRSRKYFQDLPVAAERKEKGAGREVYSPELKQNLPAYFLQNFHYQTGGYLTEDSAELYDHQVEVLFSGSANAMRRACLVPLAEFMYGRDQRQVNLIDIACGTGRFLNFVKQAYPRLNVTASDLSEAYLKEAQAHLRHRARVDYLPANAEHVPVDDESFDVVTSIYLFHEVPPKVRRIIASEFARLLKPGGRLIFMDSLQYGDAEGYDGMLESFPANFHEPYYPSYIRENLAEIFQEAGLQVKEEKAIFLSKLVVADKPT